MSTLTITPRSTTLEVSTLTITPRSTTLEVSTLTITPRSTTLEVSTLRPNHYTTVYHTWGEHSNHYTTIYHTWGEHPNHYTTHAVFFWEQFSYSVVWQSKVAFPFGSALISSPNNRLLPVPSDRSLHKNKGPSCKYILASAFWATQILVRFFFNYLPENFANEICNLKAINWKKNKKPQKRIYTYLLSSSIRLYISIASW